ncbi:NAD(P)/FAD-dependent oxidoreductase [Streptomyces aidingensis]|uniref:Thioredoxin reductase n=1 Tax=Streptomyces aidingensis TaxID=910347 RepID=A0A1I1DX06_9ACTN|nr:NAD(P)/FAD-dependent oxidoreductase [Streptomyces aidingensis]SFB79475.1 Thioredoxin reductase [Streptomyces aidingensis]
MGGHNSNDTAAAGTVPAHRYDVAVIGAGAAGLSGALILGRARRSVLVVDDGQPRNAPAEGVHGYLGHEGTPPAELLATGREEVRRYGVEFLTGTVTEAVRDGKDGTNGEDAGGAGGFTLRLAGRRTVRARRLLVTTGLTDELPEVPGLAGLWGRDVLHCPYCHGWEVRDRPIGVLATGPLAVHQALMWRQWSPHLTLFLHTGPEPDEQQRERLAARGIEVVAGEVTALETDPAGRLAGVRTAGGTVVPCRALAVATGLTARAGFLASLGLALKAQEVAGMVIGSRVPADPTGLTAVPGVWVAGNVTQVTEQVIGSAAAGVRAGAAINADLTEEETALAVAARREGRLPVS